MDEQLLAIRDSLSSLGFNKWAGLVEHLVFGTVEALLWDKVQVRYVDSSYSSYPSAPDDLPSAKLLLAAAERAREVVSAFAVPPRLPGEGYRAYAGRVADRFQQYCDETKSVPDPCDPLEQCGFIAADRFLCIHIDNRTYEEDDKAR